MQKRMGRLKKSRKQISKRGKAKNNSRANAVKRHIRSKKIATQNSKRTSKAASKARTPRTQQIGPTKLTDEKRTKSSKMKPNISVRIDDKRKNTSSIKNKDQIYEIQQRGINTALTCCKIRKSVSKHETSNNAHNVNEQQIIEENYAGTEIHEKDIGTCLNHVESESTSLETETGFEWKQDNSENRIPKSRQEAENKYWNSSDNQSLAQNRTLDLNLPHCSSNNENSDFLEYSTDSNIYNKNCDSIKAYFRERKLNELKQSKKEGNEIFKSMDTGDWNRSGIENNPLILEEHKYSKDLPCTSTKRVTKSKDNIDEDESTMTVCCRNDSISMSKIETCEKSSSNMAYLDSNDSHRWITGLIRPKIELNNSCKLCHMVDTDVTTVEDNTSHTPQVWLKPSKSNVDFTAKCTNMDTQQDPMTRENKIYTLENTKSDIVTGVASLKLLNDSSLNEANVIPSTISNVQNQEYSSPAWYSIGSNEYAVVTVQERSLQRTHNDTRNEGRGPISIKRAFCNDKFDIAVDKLSDANSSDVLRPSKHVKSKRRRFNSENVTDDCVNRSANAYSKDGFIKTSLTIEPAMSKIEHSNTESIVNKQKESALNETSLMNGECSYALVQSPNVAIPNMKMTKQKMASTVASVLGATASPHDIGTMKTITEIK